MIWLVWLLLGACAGDLGDQGQAEHEWDHESAGDFVKSHLFLERHLFQFTLFLGWDHQRGCDGPHIGGRDHQKPWCCYHLPVSNLYPYLLCIRPQSTYIWRYLDKNDQDMTVAEVIEKKEGSIQLGTPEPFAGSCTKKNMRMAPETRLGIPEKKLAQ